MFGWLGKMAIGSLVRVANDSDLARVGHCWMNGRLKIGDVLMVLAPSGDNFYDMCLVDVYANGIRALQQTRFGAYSLGELLDWQPDPEQVQTLCSYEMVRTEAVSAEMAGHAKAAVQARRDALRHAGAGDVVRVPLTEMDGIPGYAELIGVVVSNHMMEADFPGLLISFPHKTLFLDARVLERATVLQKVTAVAG